MMRFFAFWRQLLTVEMSQVALARWAVFAIICVTAPLSKRFV